MLLPRRFIEILSSETWCLGCHLTNNTPQQITYGSNITGALADFFLGVLLVLSHNFREFCRQIYQGSIGSYTWFSSVFQHVVITHTPTPCHWQSRFTSSWDFPHSFSPRWIQFSIVYPSYSILLLLTLVYLLVCRKSVVGPVCSISPYLVGSLFCSVIYGYCRT